MDKKAYRAALAALDLSQATAGKIFGVGPRTSRRWISGDAKVPPMVAFMLELMLSKKKKLELNIMDIGGRSIAERRVWTFQAREAVE